MRKPIGIFLILILLLNFTPSTLATSGTNLIVNGENVTNVDIQLISGSSYVPLRAVSTMLGIQVDWYENSKTIVIGTGKELINKMTLKSTPNLIVNSTVVTDVDVQIIKGSSYVPLRAVSTMLGTKVDWDSITQTITITDNKTKLTPETNLPPTADAERTKTYIDSIKSIIKDLTNGNVVASSTSLEYMSKNANIMLYPEREQETSSKSPYRKQSTFVNPVDLIKRVDPYYTTTVSLKALEAEEIIEGTLDSGELYTLALLRKGGSINFITNRFEDPIYFLVINIGSVDINANNLVNVYANPIGVTTIETLYLGDKPLVVMVGDLKESYSDKEYMEMTEDIYGLLPELNEAKERQNSVILSVLTARLAGTKVEFDSIGQEVEVIAVSIDGYSYTHSTPIPIPFNGFTIPLDNLKNKQGHSFQPTDGHGYTVDITTNLGQTSKYVFYDKDSIPRSDRLFLQGLKSNIESNFEDLKLHLDYSGDIDIEVNKLSIGDEFIYNPDKPVYITTSNSSMSFNLNNFKNTSGTSFVPTYGYGAKMEKLTIFTNYGEIEIYVY